MGRASAGCERLGTRSASGCRLLAKYGVISSNGKSVRSIFLVNTILPLPSSHESVAIWSGDPPTRHRQRLCGPANRQYTRTPSHQSPSHAFALRPVSLTKRFLAYRTLCCGDSRLSIALRCQALHISLGSHPCRQPRSLTTLSPCGTAMKSRAPSGFWTPPPSLAPGPLPKTFHLGTRPTGALGSSQVPRPSGSMSRMGREHTQGESQ